jgi:hypothetical protein
MPGLFEESVSTLGWCLISVIEEVIGFADFAVVGLDAIRFAK